MFEIKKDIPKPAPFLGTRKKWPWADMEPGDSVTIPPELVAKAKNSLNAWRSHHRDRRFIRRTLVDGSLRIWRDA